MLVIEETEFKGGKEREKPTLRTVTQFAFEDQQLIKRKTTSVRNHYGHGPTGFIPTQGYVCRQVSASEWSHLSLFELPIFLQLHLICLISQYFLSHKPTATTDEFSTLMKKGVNVLP